MEDFKSMPSRGSECQLDIGAEIEVDQTGSEMSSVQKKSSVCNNKLPQRNSGFEKKSLKGNCTKPPMLGVMTFREIAQKRKVMLKSGLVDHKKNVSCSILTKESENNYFKPDKEDERKPVENVPFYINPHKLVGKTITLQQGDIPARHIKFLSQDSNCSPNNKKLLKLDKLQLTPKFILSKCKPEVLSSKETPRDFKNCGKIQDCQNEDTPSKTKPLEVNSQPRSKSLPDSHKIVHENTSHNSQSEKNEITMKPVGFLAQKSSSEKDDLNFTTEHFIGVRGEGNMSKCSILNKPDDYNNLTMLSQVALEEEARIKEEANYSPRLKDKVRFDNKKTYYEYVSLDHCYEKSEKPIKKIVSLDHCYEKSEGPIKKTGFNEQPAKVRTVKNEVFLRKKSEKINSVLSKRNKRELNKKPMFAWCTQYITHSRSHNTNDDNFIQKQEFPSKRAKLYCPDNNTLSKSMKYKKVVTQSMKQEQSKYTPIANLNDSFKIQDNLQKQDDYHKKHKINVETMNSLEKLNKAPTIFSSQEKTLQDMPEAKVMFLSKSQLCSESDDKNVSHIKSAKVAERPLFSTNEEKIIPEVNDEIIIVKEILVTKSPSFNVFPTKGIGISKQKLNNNQLQSATSSQRSTNGVSKNALMRKILTEIPVNEEQTSKTIHKHIDDQKPPDTCLETTKLSLKNLPPYASNKPMITIKEINDNKEANDIRKLPKGPLKAMPSQPSLIKSEETHKTEDPIKGGENNCSIKKCFVLVERLNYANSVTRKDIIENTIKNPNISEMYCVSNSPNISLEENREQIDVKMPNLNSKFTDKEQIKESNILQDQMLTISYIEKKNILPDLRKDRTSVSKIPLSPIIRKCKGSSKECNKIVVFKANISPSNASFKTIESYNDNHDSSVPNEYIVEIDPNNSLTCHGNDKVKLQTEKDLSRPENNFDCEQSVLLNKNKSIGCKRKIKFLDENSTDFIEYKKVKHPREKPKKMTAQVFKQSKQSTANNNCAKKENILNAKHEDESVNIGIDDLRESSFIVSKRVQQLAGKPKKLIKNKAFNCTRQLTNKSITVKKEGKSNKKLQDLTAKIETDNLRENRCIVSKRVKQPGRPKKPIKKKCLNRTKLIWNKLQNERMEVDTDDFRESNINVKGVTDQDNMELSVLNKKNSPKKLSPEGAFTGNREIYSLLADFKALGCSIEPIRKLRNRSANFLPQSDVKLESLKDKPISNQNNTTPIACNQISQTNAVIQSETHTNMHEFNDSESKNKLESIKRVLNKELSTSDDLGMNCPKPSQQKNKKESSVTRLKRIRKYGPKNATYLKQNKQQNNIGKSLTPAEIVYFHPAFPKQSPTNVINKSLALNQVTLETFNTQINIIPQDVEDPQQNLSKSGELHTDQNPSQSCICDKSPDNVKLSQNVSQVYEDLKHFKGENTQVQGKKKNVVKELKRKQVPLNIDTKKRKKMNLSRTDIENKPDNIKISQAVTTRSHKTQLKVNKAIKLPSNFRKDKSVKTTYRVTKKSSASTIKNRQIISITSSPTDSEKLNIPEWSHDKENLQDAVHSNKQSQPKKFSCKAEKEKKGQSSSPPRIKRLRASIQKKKNLKQFSKLLMKPKQKRLDPSHAAVDVKISKTRSLIKDANKCLVNNAISAKDSRKPKLEDSNLKDSSALLCNGKEQSGTVRVEAVFSTQILENKKSVLSRQQNKLVCGKSRLKHRKFDQKETKTQYISKCLTSHDNLFESDPTTECVQMQKTSDCNALRSKSCTITSARFKKTPQHFTPHKTSKIQNSKTDSQQNCIENFGNKSSVNNETSLPSSIKSQPIVSHTGINRKVSEVTTEVNCSFNGTNLIGQDKVETSNSQVTTPNQCTVRDKIRLLLMEQLKRSKRSHKVVIENVTPKR